MGEWAFGDAGIDRVYTQSVGWNARGRDVPVQDTARECGEFMRPHSCDVPFGGLVPCGCANLLVASAKSISTEPAGLIRGIQTETF